MKTKILSLVTITSIVFFTSCASEDTSNKQSEHEQDTKGLTSFVEEDRATRTTAEYDGSGLNFYWTEGDRLWVNTGGTLIQDARNNIDSKLENNPANPSAVQRVAKAQFWFNGTFTANSYPVRYTGKNGVKDKITIKANQMQLIPNDASHIAEDGDFGVATATKLAGTNQYHFTLDHKAAYITFMPYSSVIAGVNLHKIRVFTDNSSDALTGTFDIADDGTLSNPASTSNSVKLDLKEDEASNSSFFDVPSTRTNSTITATMVVIPGTYHNVSIEYTVRDMVTGVTAIITKTYPSVTFTAGLNKKVETDLQVTSYPCNLYYQWDAQENYWAGYEWGSANPTQPTLKNERNNNDAPKSTVHSSAHTTRDFNDLLGYDDDTGTAPAVLPTTSHFKNLPNVNEMLWYIRYGDPHWDNTTVWATMGHLYTGGMWFKKRSKISRYNANEDFLGRDNTRSNTFVYDAILSFSEGKPSNLSDYFYLPALGMYGDGQFQGIGEHGVYWASTPCPPESVNKNSSYILAFTSFYVYVMKGNRHVGYRLWDKNNEDQYRPNGL